jgi:hypothetical protein
MAEHFSKSTVEAKFWCKPCGKPTVHYVFDGRRGGCQECIKRRENEAAVRRPAPAKQETLF